MDTYNLHIELKSPLALSKQRNANLISTLDYIPAATLRGAIAARIMQHEKVDRDVFDAAIIAGGLKFSAMYASYNENAVEVLPAPFTLLSCKNNPGFGDGGEGHGMEDALLFNVAYALDKNEQVLDHLSVCSQCGNVLKNFKGSLLSFPDGNYCPSPVLPKRQQAHVGLDRARRGAASGILYARQVISNANPETDNGITSLQGSIQGEASHLNWLRSYVKQGQTLHIGNAVSRGLGRCSISEFSRATEGHSLEHRIHQFNEALDRYVDNRQGVIISITLRTPTFFVDAFLRPNLSPDAKDFLQAAEVEELKWLQEFKGMEKIYQTARLFRYVGWNQLANFPRSTEIGLQAGSVFVFRCDSLSTDLLAALEHLEQAGIGLNRKASFGKISICDPVHTHIHEMTQATMEVVA